jgi:hypothetical protein
MRMMYITKGDFRHFIPAAPARNYYLPVYDLYGDKILHYEFSSDGTGVATMPDFFNGVEGSISVTCNGIDLKQTDYKYDTYFLTVSSYYELQVTVLTDSQDPTKVTTKSENVPVGAIPPIGKLIEVNVSIPTPIGDTGWQYFDFSELLIQGANPTDQTVLDEYHNFQGGYRLMLEIISQPAFGEAVISDYKLGIRYKAPVGFKGLDSFSYRLVTEFGQKSEPACISLHVGM